MCTWRAPRASLRAISRSKGSSLARRSRCACSARGSTSTRGMSQRRLPKVGVSPKSVATGPPPESQVMRCCASVSQNQSAESSIRLFSRSSCERTASSSRSRRRANRYITRYAIAAEMPARSSASLMEFTRASSGAVAHGWRDLEHFLDGGEPRAHLHCAADAKRFHAFLEPLLAQRREVGLLVHEALDRTGEKERLV